MILAPIKEYFNMITEAYKVAFLSILIMSAIGYVGYLHLRIHRAEADALYYKSVAESYRVSAFNMKDRLDLERSNHKKTVDYYESLECVERKKGPLTDEELTGRPKPKDKPKEKPKKTETPAKKSSWFNLF